MRVPLCLSSWIGTISLSLPSAPFEILVAFDTDVFIYLGYHYFDHCYSSYYRWFWFSSRCWLVWCCIVRHIKTFVLSAFLMMDMLTLLFKKKSRLASCMSQLSQGKLSENYRLKSIFFINVVVFEIGILISGFASSSTMFIIGRAVAGLGFSGIGQGCMV